MKKMLFILMALLIATPAMAAVTLTNGAPSGTTVTIGWSGNGATAATRARGFALTLVATGGTITSVTPYMTGQSGATKGYGIFPGTFTVLDANNPNWSTAGYSPVEPNQLHNSGKSKLTTEQVIVALGSLYGKHTGDSDANAPGATGNLFTVVCSSTTTSLTVTPEVTYRGGVVGEDANSITVAALNIGFYAGTRWDVAQCAGQPFGDVNCDGNVNISDLGALKASWLKSKGNVAYNCGADFDRSGGVNIADLGILKAHWLHTPAYTPHTGITTCPP